jgi:hypothetical protein
VSRADELAGTPAERVCLDALRAVSGETDGAMERHCAWPPERLNRCLDAVEQHHALRDRSSFGVEVELMRRADLVDVSAGLVNFGIDRWWVRNLVREIPRSGFHRFLARETWRMARERPRSLPHVFAPPGHTP